MAPHHNIPIGGFPLACFTGLQKDAVGLLVHPVSHRLLHLFRRVPIDPVGLQHSMLHHHHHLGLMDDVHFSGSDVEFVNKFVGVLDHEANSLAFLNVEAFWLVKIITHYNVDRARGVRRLAGFANSSDSPGPLL
jgi:hypothetical protein